MREDLADDARLLKEVLVDFGALYRALLIKVNINVLAEPTRVVVANRFCIAERCKDRTYHNPVTNDASISL